ncbi:hypothetical protein EDB92DRAFT_1820177 [Lactarius akahatsu]|uniref:Uncharacterized protein n=1 Tax=Lactarius akahatsu TaxID=416441 RepID=A0AAD4Q3N5_9AGAM|nr:hypothetical protein EDB92DRAFT_1820177 [Lactarius akahatsu]
MATTTATTTMEEATAAEEARRIAEEAESYLQPINPTTGHRMTANDSTIFRAEGEDPHHDDLLEDHLEILEEDHQGEDPQEKDHSKAHPWDTIPKDLDIRVSEFQAGVQTSLDMYIGFGLWSLKT